MDLFITGFTDAQVARLNAHRGEEDASEHCTIRDSDCLEIALYGWILQVDAGRRDL